jgi:hypothetical protein
MLRRRGGLLLGLVMLAALLGGAVWWLLGEAGPRGAASPGAPSEEREVAAAVTAADGAATDPLSAVPPVRTAEALGADAVIAPVGSFMPDGERGQSVTGLVVDAGGGPVGDARVELLDVSLGPERPLSPLHAGPPASPGFGILAEARTGADGRFVLLVSESRARVHRHLLPTGKAGKLCHPLVRASLPGLLPAVRKLAVGAEEVVDVGTLALELGGALRGRLGTAGGEPVPDAAVLLRSHASPKPGMEDEALASGAPADHRTGSDGRFEIAGIPPGLLAVELEHEGWQIVRPALVEIVAGETADLGDLVLAEGARLEGRVLDPEGAPLPGATVALSTQSFFTQSSAARTRSDESGSFVLQGLAPGVQQTLEARAKGFAAGTLRVNVPPEDPVTFRLEREGSLSLEVLGPDGAPLPRGEAQIFEGRRRLGLEAVRDGDARLPDAAAGHVLVQAPGCAAWAGAARKKGVPAGSLAVRLVRESVVRGVVRDEAGRALPGLVVRLVPKAEAFKHVAFEPADISDEAGRFELTGLSAGAASLQAERSGLVPLAQALELAEGETRSAELVLASGGRVTGRVVTGRGAGVPGALVRAGPITAPGPHVTADGEGRFTLAGLPPGTTWIGLWDGTGAIEVEVTAGGTTHAEIRAADAASVTGRITSAGRPMAGYVVRASPGKSSTDGPYRDLTDEAGRFELHDLKPGLVRLGVTDPAGRFLHGEDLELSDGERRHVDIALSDVTLRIVVRAAEDGRPIPGARVHSSPRRKFNSVTREADAQGVLVLEHMTDASLWISATASGRLPAEVVAEQLTFAPERTVTLELERAGMLSGLVQLADTGPMVTLSVTATGPPLSGAEAAAAAAMEAAWGGFDEGGPATPSPVPLDVRHASVDRDGRFTFDELPAGRWTVVVVQHLDKAGKRGPHELARATADVAVGETARLTLIVQPVRGP